MRISWFLLAASALSFIGVLLDESNSIEFSVTTLLIAGAMRKIEDIEARMRQ